MIRENEVLNIYSDASMSSIDGITYGCPGAMAVWYGTDSMKVLETTATILYDSTNNQSEIYAVLLAVNLAIKYKYSYPYIRIISDSRISVEGLRNWIYSWVHNSKNGVLMSSSGSAVANQEIFLYIIYSILNNLSNCSICHIDGHRREYNDTDVTKTMSNFYKTNKVRADKDTIIQHITHNNHIDQLTRNYLQNGLMNNLPTINVNNIKLVERIPTPQELEVYKRVTVTF